MKKFITLLFFAVCISSAFAQGHEHQNNNQSNGNGYQQYQNYGNNGSNQYSQNNNGRYSQDQHYNVNYSKYDNQQGYAYNNDRDRFDDKGSGARDNRWREDDHFGHFDHRFDRDSYRERHRRGGFFQIRIW